VHVGVLVAIRHVLAIRARQEAHGQHFRLQDALARAQDRNVDELNRETRNRLQPRVAVHRAQVRQGRNLREAVPGEGQREANGDQHAEHRALGGLAGPEAATKAAERRQAGTGAEQDERPRLRGRLAGVIVVKVRIKTAHYGTSIEEELRIITELTEAAVVDAADREDRGDLLVRAERAAEG